MKNSNDPSKARKTNFVLLIIFAIFFGILILLNLLMGCTGTKGATQYELTGIEQYYGKIYYYSHFKKDKSDQQCPYITNIHVKLDPENMAEDPLLIVICGYHDHIKIGEKVWVKKTLPLNYADPSKHLITNGHIYPILGIKWK